MSHRHVDRRFSVLLSCALSSKTSARTSIHSSFIILNRRQSCRQPRYISSIHRPKRPCSQLTDSSSHGGTTNLARAYSTDLPPPSEGPRIAIVGSGLTGLTAAYYLAMYIPNSRVVMYEASDRVGGWVKSEVKEVDVNGHKQSVMFERGPRSMSPGDMIHGKQDRLILYDIMLNTGLKCVPGPPRLPRYIYHGGRIVTMPPHNPIINFWREPLFRTMLPGALYWLVRWFLRGPNTFPKDDVSVADYIKQASGSTGLADVLSAGIHGVWGGNIEKLSAMSVFSWFFHSSAMSNSHGGVVKRRLTEEVFKNKFLAENPHVKEFSDTRPKSEVLTCGEYGLEALPIAIHDMLESADNVDIRLGSPVERITYQEHSKAIEVQAANQKPELFDKVISTLPAQHLAKLTDGHLPALESFHSVSIMAVNIWYPEPNLIPPGIGYLIPRSCPPDENPERALGVMFDSNLLAERTAKEGGTKVYVLLGGHYYDDMPIPSEEEAVEQAKTLLERHLGIPRDTPCAAFASLKKECIPQHYVGHYKRITEANSQLEDKFHGTLAAVGGSFSRPGIMGALRSGHDIAQTIMAKENFLATGLEELQEERVKDPLYPLTGPRALLDYMTYVKGRPTKPKE